MTKKLDDFSNFNVNPFFNEIYKRNIIQAKDRKYSVPTSIALKDYDGKSMGYAFVKKQERNYFDAREFIRIPVEALGLISSLQQTELKILCYILDSIEQNSLVATLSTEKIKHYYGYKSRNPIYKGIIGLLQKRIIARKKSTKPEYYLNPIFSYKGTIVKEFFKYLVDSKLENKNSNLRTDKELYNKRAAV